MIPKNLKIGDTFTETTADNHILKYKVIGFDGAGNYISEYIGDEKKVDKPVVEDIPLEELPFADVEPEEPKVEEKKKAPAKRKPATKKKTATKKKA